MGNVSTWYYGEDTTLNTSQEIKKIEKCNENRETPTHPRQLLSYIPPFGHELGFDHFGLRYDINVLNNISREKWTVKELSEYVDVITWANIGNLELDDTMDFDADTSDALITGLGNVAYSALYHPEEEMRLKYLDFLKRAGKLEE